MPPAQNVEINAIRDPISPRLTIFTERVERRPKSLARRLSMERSPNIFFSHFLCPKDLYSG